MASGALSIPNRQIDGWLKRKVRKILDTTICKQRPLEPPNIYQLAISGDATRLFELLKEQPELANTINDNSWSPLQGAACNGNTECVKLLLEAGAGVNVQSCNDSTALHCSAEDGNTEIVELLLMNNADPNLIDNNGKTPLDWAVWNNHKDIIELLKKFNAKSGVELTELHEENKS